MIRPKFPNLKNKYAKKRATILGLTGLLVFVTLLTLTFSYTTTSESCVLCHSMKPEFDAWEQSSHRRLPCMGCHMPPGGATALIWDHIKAGKFVPAEFLGYHTPINPESEVSQHHISNEQCERCHDLETRKVTPSPQLAGMTSQAHLKHLDAGLHCTTCHNRITHRAMDEGKIEYEKGEEGNYFKYKNFMQMKDGCMRCHSGKLEKPYKAKNGAIAPTSCTTCHPAGWEGLPLGHGDDWRKTHPAMAKQKIGYCLNPSTQGPTSGCHSAGATFNYEGKTFCVSCHSSDEVKDFEKIAARQKTEKEYHK